MSKKKISKDMLNEDIKDVGADLKKDTKEVMEKVTETNETIKEDIAKAVKAAEETDVKDVAKRAGRKAKKAEETVEKKVEEAVDKTDAAVKKADEAVKKAARKAAGKAAPKEKVYLQYLGKDMDVEDIMKAARKDWCDKSGEGEENIKSVNLYLKPEDDAAYYVVNGSDSGMVKI